MQLFVRGLENVETIDVQQDVTIAAVKVSLDFCVFVCVSVFLLKCFVSILTSHLVLVALIVEMFLLISLCVFLLAGSHCPTPWLQH